MTPIDEKFDSYKDGYTPPLLKMRQRPRTIFCIALNLLLFAGVCVFWGYLHSARWTPFAGNIFRLGMISPTGMLLLKPLSIFTHPWMIVIVGLLLGVLVLVPLIMAIMYPLFVSIACVVLVGVVGESPLLGLTLLMGCLVAAKTRLRRQYPFLAIIFGMIPVCVFFYIWIYLGLDVATLLPMQQWVLAIPFFLAILLVMVVGQVIVMLVRFNKFQPGAIWPVVLGIGILPAALFFPLIGDGELRYNSLVENELSGKMIFTPISQAKWVEQHGQGLGDQALNCALQDDLDRKKLELSRKCDDYLARHKTNRRAVEIAWLRACCSNMQCDLSGMDDRVIVYSGDFTHSAAQQRWEQLLQQYPQSDQAGLAQWHLGVLKLREVADIDDDTEVLKQAEAATQMLSKTRQKLSEVVTAHHRRKKQRRSWTAEIFKTAPTLPDEQNYTRRLFDLDCLLWKINDNDVLTDPNSARGMARLLSISPHSENYPQQLKKLAANPDFSKTKMTDNFQMALAKAIRNPYERADALKKLTEDELTDTAIEAYYELGRISMQTAGARIIALALDSPEDLFGKVVEARPNPWSTRAKNNLAWLEQNALRYKKKVRQSQNEK